MQIHLLPKAYLSPGSILPRLFENVRNRLINTDFIVFSCLNICNVVIWINTFLLKEAVTRRCSIKKVFLKSLWNSQENTLARVSFLAIFEKLIFNVLHKQNVKTSTQFHSELSIWPCGIPCAFIEQVTTGFHLRYHTCYHTFKEIFHHFY